MQYPCALKGDRLYDPFCEAVRCVENCGLKVHILTIHCMYKNIINIDVLSGATCSFNDSSANRKLIKLHNSSSNVTS